MTKRTLDDFIKDTRQFPNNEWVKADAIDKLYVRKGTQYFRTIHSRDGMGHKQVLTLSNIQISDPRFRGKGHFTRLIEKLEREHPKMTLVVENVLTERFALYLHTHGWERIVDADGNPTMPACFAKFKHPEE